MELMNIINVNKRYRIANSSLKDYLTKERQYKSVLKDINLKIFKGEILGIVGESGSGKTTLIRTLMRLTEPDSGQAYFQGQDIFKMSKQVIRNTIRNQFRMIFQHPDAAFNPAFTVEQIFNQASRQNGILKKSAMNYEELLSSVRLGYEFLHKRSHQLSGGEKRRVSVCRAILTRPSVIFADEPTSGLDLHLQHQIIDIFLRMKKDYNLTIVIISHDIKMIERICDRICVMYQGRIVEIGDKKHLALGQRSHPYTRELLRCDLGVRKVRANINSEILNYNSLKDKNTNGHGKCDYADLCDLKYLQKESRRCFTCIPLLKEVKSGHHISCHFI
ncbi:ABC transporter ATP-binding protein [bacterium]|nr:ABC transporter ATP-binding protein [bacterium]